MRSSSTRAARKALSRVESDARTIARRRARHEHHDAFGARDAVAARGDGLDRHLGDAHRSASSRAARSHASDAVDARSDWRRAPLRRLAIAVGDERRDHGRRARDVRRRLRVNERIEPPLEPLDLDRAGAKLGVFHDAQVKVARRLDAFDRELEQRAMHALDGSFSRRRVDDQLREHRIVEQPDLAPDLDAAVPPHARAARQMQIRDAARRRKEAVRRILARDAALDRPSARHDVLLTERQLLARGDANLPLHEVDAGHELRDRMLDLEARVHLEEVELAVAVEQELAGAGVHVPAALAARTAVSPIARRSSGVTATLGASSIIF